MGPITKLVNSQAELHSLESTAANLLHHVMLLKADKTEDN